MGMGVIEAYKFNSGNIPVDVSIESDKNEFVMIYKISISQISSTTEVILEKIRNELVDKVKLGIGDVTDPKKFDYIKQKFQKTIISLIKKYMPDLSDETLDFFTTYLMHKSFGLGRIELLMSDKGLEEVVINSADEPVWVYHHKYGWLKTNIELENEELIKHYSTVIARRVGRSITLLNPLLDAHLEGGDRVNSTLQPISTHGNTITIRKFASKPITITNFIQNKSISVSAAALVWLAMEYEMSALVSGGTASGKTSFLGALCSFFPPNQRIISVEDSVTGDAELLYKKKGIIKKGCIGELIDSKVNKEKLVLTDGCEVHENKDVEVLSMDKIGRVGFTKPSLLIRHYVKKPIIQVRLSSGKEISVTKDHSLFGLVDNEIKETRCRNLKIGSFIATPRKIWYEGAEKTFDLTGYLEIFNGFMVKGEPVKRLIKDYGGKIIKKGTKRRYYLDRGIVPVRAFKKLARYVNEEDKERLCILSKSGNKKGRTFLPFKIRVDELFSVIAGMWMADGCYDKKSILISDPGVNVRELVERFATRFGARVRLHNDGITLMINSRCLRIFFEKVMELKGDAYTKRIPEWIFGLNKELHASLVKGYFNGDGCVKKDEISVNSCSRGLLKDIQTMLLRFEIPLRIGLDSRKDKTYEARISGSKFLKRFNCEVGFIQNDKNLKLLKLIDRKPHDMKDVIPLAKNAYLYLKHQLGYSLKNSLEYSSWKSWQGRYKKSDIGREYLRKLIQLSGINEISMVDGELRKIIKLSENDIFWDRVVEIKEVDYEGYVYDLSVPENESFICNNVIAHNTREVQLPKYLHWVPMNTREPNVEGKGGVEMLDLIVNSLRMRPDRIVVGEIRRKKEAETLFEAMHTGHSVYATVHANNAEETVNRLTNPPIDVPKAMLPAVSLIVNMYRNRRTGLRRIFQIAEITEDAKANVLLQLDLRGDKLVAANESRKLMPDLQTQTGMNQQEINKSLEEKGIILKWLVKNNIDTVDGIGKVVATYYTNKESLMGFLKNA